MGVSLATLSSSSHLSHPDPPSTQEVLHLSHNPLSQPLCQTLLPGSPKKEPVKRIVGVIHCKDFVFTTQNKLLWDF